MKRDPLAASSRSHVKKNNRPIYQLLKKRCFHKSIIPFLWVMRRCRVS